MYCEELGGHSDQVCCVHKCGVEVPPATFCHGCGCEIQDPSVMRVSAVVQIRS